MRATVTFRLPDGEFRTLGHGAMIGRLWNADLYFNDGRISEAHAMVSLRGRELKLLALRGRFRLQDRPVSELTLAQGQVISLASGLDVVVEAVEIPQALMAIEAPGMARQVLTGVSSLYGGSRPRLVAGWKRDAGGHVWLTGEAWMRDGPGQGPQVIQPGESWEVNGVAFTAVAASARADRATVHETAYAVPITLVNRFDTVHLCREGHATLVISGHAARILSDLACAGTAMSWDDLAAEIWSDDLPRQVLRSRWDMQMMRLRKRLKEAGIRTDLIRPDGAGLIELVLGIQDKVIDET